MSAPDRESFSFERGGVFYQVRTHVGNGEARVEVVEQQENEPVMEGSDE
jgi:hypothetical protein